LSENQKKGILMSATNWDATASTKTDRKQFGFIDIQAIESDAAIHRLRSSMGNQWERSNGR
jgi:hypothetical protein